MRLAVSEPERRQGVAASAGRHLEVRLLAGEERGLVACPGGVRAQERDPEAVLDDVERHLPAANRSLDEAHHRELGLVEHEAVTRLHGQGFEGPKRVGRQLGLVAREPIDSNVGLDEQLSVKGETRRAEGVGHLGFRQRALLADDEAVVHAIALRIVEGSP